MCMSCNFKYSHHPGAGDTSLYGYIGMWSEIGFGLFTQVLNWVCFLEEASSSLLGD